MATNALLAKIEKAKEQSLYTGIEIGFQMAVDFISLAANDSECVGKNNVLGEKRIMAILEGAKKYRYELSDAFCLKKESDYQREILDRLLQGIFKENFAPFEVRYPQIKEVTYGRAK